MRLTTCEPFRAIYTAVQAMQKHVWQARHHMTFLPRLAIPTTTMALVPRLAGADHGWGYRRAGMDLRSDRDVDSAFFIRNT